MKWIGRILYIALVVIIGFFVLRFSQINAQVKYYNENAVQYLEEDNRDEYISRYMTANLIDKYLEEPIYLGQSSDANNFEFEFAIYHLKVTINDQEISYLAFYFNEITFNKELLLDDYEKYNENNNLATILIEVKMKDVDEIVTEYYPLDVKMRMPVVILQQTLNESDEPTFGFQVVLEGESEHTVKNSNEIEKISLVLSDLTASEDGNDPTRTIISEIKSNEENVMVNPDNLVTEDNVIVSTNFNGVIDNYVLDEKYNDENNLGEIYTDDLNVYLKAVPKSLTIYGLIVVGLTFLIFFLKPLLNYLDDKKAIRRKEERDAEKELEALEKRQTEAVIEEAEFVEDETEEVLDVEENEDSLNSVKEVSTIDYNTMTVAELKELAKEMELTNYSTLRKNELIDLIKQNK